MLEAALSPVTFRRPLVFFTNGLGDLLMFVPTLRALAGLFPGRLEVMCRNGAGDAVLGELGLATIHPDFLSGRDGDEPFSPHEIPEGLKQADCLICLNDWDSPAVDSFVRAVAPKASIGFDPVFDVQLDRRFDVHNSLFAFEVLRAFGSRARFEDFTYPIEGPDWVQRTLDGIREELPEGAILVAVHAETGSFKNLPVEAWVQIIDLLLERNAHAFVMLVGVEDTGIEDRVRYGDRVLPLFGATLELSIGLVGGSDYFIGIDSSMLHAADLQGTPGVGVFRSTDPVRWGYGVTRHVHVGCVDPPGKPEDVVRIVDAFDRIALGLASRALLQAVDGPPVLEDLRAAVRPAALFSYGIGDHLVQLPVIRALSSLYPGRLSLRCRTDLQSLIYGGVDLRGCFEDEYSADQFGEHLDEQRLPPELLDADLILSTHHWDSPAVGRMLKALGPVRSVGFDWEFSDRVQVDTDLHVMQDAFKVVQYIDPSLRLEDFAEPFVLPKESSEFARGVREELGPRRKLLTVHPTCSQEWKDPPLPYWREFLDRFLDERSDYVVLLLGLVDSGLASGPHADRIIPCHGLSLDRSFALVEASDLFVGMDSCLVHAADLFRVPTVGVYGPSNSTMWGACLTRFEVTECGLDMLGADPFDTLEKALGLA